MFAGCFSTSFLNVQRNIITAIIHLDNWPYCPLVLTRLDSWTGHAPTSKCRLLVTLTNWKGINYLPLLQLLFVIRLKVHSDFSNLSLCWQSGGELFLQRNKLQNGCESSGFNLHVVTLHENQTARSENIALESSSSPDTDILFIFHKHFPSDDLLLVLSVLDPVTFMSLFAFHLVISAQTSFTLTFVSLCLFFALIFLLNLFPYSQFLLSMTNFYFVYSFTTPPPPTRPLPFPFLCPL